MTGQPRYNCSPRQNAAARAIRFGFPWVYDNELVMDRRSRKRMGR